MPLPIPAISAPLSFEHERDDLLRRYENDGRYRADGRYSADAFAGLRDCFRPKLVALLQKYSSTYPTLYEGLELCLTRVKKVLPSGRVQYDFDGIFLVERLKRQVGRLKLGSQSVQAVSGLHRPVFIFLRPAPVTLVVQQQRYHYEQAGHVLTELAAATTRDLLTSSEVSTALCQLRAFFPNDAVATVSNLPTLLHTILTRNLHRQPWSQVEAEGISSWWHNCFGLTSTWPHPEHREAWRREHELAYQRFAQSTIRQHISISEAEHLLTLARQAQQQPTNTAFSSSFWQSYFLRVLLTASYQDPIVRVRLGTAGLYGFAEHSHTDIIGHREQADAICLLQKLTNHQPILLDTLITELVAIHASHPISLDYHDYLSRFLSKDDGPLYRLYECLASIELPETELGLEFLNAAQESLDYLAPMLENLSLVGAAFVASYLRPLARLVFEAPGFLANQQALLRLYNLLAAELTPDEKEVIENELLDQLLPTIKQPDSVLRHHTSLACILRQRLQQRLIDTAVSVNSPCYLLNRNVLFEISPSAEYPSLVDIMQDRYDIRYLLFNLDLHYPL